MIYQKVIETLIKTNSVKATYYISPKKVVKATRKRYNGKFSRYGIDIVLTIGRPNFMEKKFIKSCQKADVKFPISKVQIRPLPKKKK